MRNRSHTITIDVPFYDIDAMNVVYHGNYVKYFEQARCAWLNAINMNYTRMSLDGWLFPVVRLSVKYIRPCVFGQVIAVTATLQPCDNCLIFRYLITDSATGEKLCTGETRQMCVNKETLQSCYELPLSILATFAAAESGS